MVLYIQEKIGTREALSGHPRDAKEVSITRTGLFLWEVCMEVKKNRVFGRQR